MEMPSLNTSDIIKMFSTLLIPTVKMPTVPSVLILMGAEFRNGLSPRRIAHRIIVDQGRIGAPMGDLPDGSPSITEQMELIRVQAIVEALQTEAKIEVAIAPGQQVDGTFVGVGSGYIKGLTTTIGSGSAIIR